jgi:predicted  nucleic acid-binding Zn-ribbon protein
VLRGQLTLMKDTNTNIEVEVKKGSEEIKRMRKQLNKNMSDQNQIHGASQELEENLQEQLMTAEAKIRQLEQDLSLAHRKYQH